MADVFAGAPGNAYPDTYQYADNDANSGSDGYTGTDGNSRTYRHATAGNQHPGEADVSAATSDGYASSSNRGTEIPVFTGRFLQWRTQCLDWSFLRAHQGSGIWCNGRWVLCEGCMRLFCRPLIP